MLMLQVRQLTLVTSHPDLPFCKQSSQNCTSFKMFWGFISVFSFVTKVIPSDLLPGDHMCEKSDAVNWIDCP